MKKRLSLVASILLVTTLSACGGKDIASPSTSGAKGASIGSVGFDKPIELTVFYPYAGDYTDEEFAAKFSNPVKEKFPNVTLKYMVSGTGTKIEDLIGANEPIDIVFSSIGASNQYLTDYQLQSDITPFIKKYNYDLNKLDPEILNMGKTLANGNGLYGLPVTASSAALYYNKDIFDKFGVPYPKDGMTWDDVYDLSKKLTRKNDNTQYYGFGTMIDHMALTNQYSLSIVDNTNKAVIETDKWKEYLDSLIRFYKLPGYENWTKNDYSVTNQRNHFFKDRNVAMWVTPVSTYTAADFGDMNWDLVTFPTYKELPAVGPQPYPAYWYVASTSQYKEQAFQVIAFLTSNEYQLQQSKAGSFVSVLKDPAIRSSFGQDEVFLKGKNAKALVPAKYAPGAPVNKYNSSSRGTMNGGVMVPIILGQKDINTALRDGADSINKKIADDAAAANKK